MKNPQKMLRIYSLNVKAAPAWTAKVWPAYLLATWTNTAPVQPGGDKRTAEPVGADTDFSPEQ